MLLCAHTPCMHARALRPLTQVLYMHAHSLQHKLGAAPFFPAIGSVL